MIKNRVILLVFVCKIFVEFFRTVSAVVFFLRGRAVTGATSIAPRQPHLDSAVAGRNRNTGTVRMK